MYSSRIDPPNILTPFRDTHIVFAENTILLVPASTLTCPDCGYGKTETMPTALRKNYVKNVLPCPGPWLDNG